MSLKRFIRLDLNPKSAEESEMALLWMLNALGHFSRANFQYGSKTRGSFYLFHSDKRPREYTRAF